MEFSGHQRDVRVLLVQPGSTVSSAVRWKLAALGLNLHCADNGYIAIERMKDSTPDVVVTDTHSTGLTGIEFGQFMRAQPTLRHVPLIFLSDDIGYDLAVTSQARLGSIDFLPKPLDVDQLAARVTQLLQHRPRHTHPATSNTAQRLVSPFLPFAAGS